MDQCRGMMTLLTIDVGSSSVRVHLFDDQSSLIENSVVSRKYSFNVTTDGGSTIDASYLRNLVEQCIDKVLKHPLAQIPIATIDMRDYQ